MPSLPVSLSLSIVDGYRLQKSKVDCSLFAPGFSVEFVMKSVSCFVPSKRSGSVSLRLLNSSSEIPSSRSHSDGERFSGWDIRHIQQSILQFVEREYVRCGRLKVWFLNVWKYLSGKLFIVNQGLKNRQFKLGNHT